MKLQHCAGALFLLVGFGPAVHAENVTITFDRIQLVEKNYTYVDTPYEENGFVIRVLQVPPEPDPIAPSPVEDCNIRAMAFEGPAYSSFTGSPAPIFYGSCDRYDLELRRVDGTAFTFASVDLKCCDGSNFYEDERAYFTVVYADGSERPLASDRLTNSLATYQFDASGIVALRWKGGLGNYAIFPIYDNFVVGPGAVSLTPWINLTPASVDFGQTVIGGKNIARLSVQNVGTSPLQVDSVASSDALNAPFAVDRDLCTGNTVEPGSACTVDLVFSPVAAGEYSDSFEVVSNDPYRPVATVAVAGLGVALGGQAIGMTRVWVTCVNVTRRKSVTFPLPTEAAGLWDCQSSGLEVRSNDAVIMSLHGRAE